MIKQQNIGGENKKGKRMCSFYASDYHFELMVLPYIAQGNKSIILTENDLEESMKIVLSRTNIEEDKKNEIIKMDWNRREKKVLNNELNENLTVFIKGGKKYIKEMDEYLKNTNSNFNIVHCFNACDVQNDIANIVKDYSGIFKTFC